MKKILRFIYHAAIVVAFLLAIAAGFTQTNVFHSYLRSTLVDQFSQNLRGTVAIGAVEGNLFTSFRLRNVTVESPAGPVLHTDNIAVKYDPWGVIVRRVLIREFVVSSPEIHIWRGLDSVWNVQSLVPPSSGDTTRSKWSFSARRIVLEQGSISVVDSVALRDRLSDTSRAHHPGAIDYAQLQADNVDLSLSVLLDQGHLLCAIDRLGLELRHPQFKIRQLQGSFTIGDKDVAAHSVLLQTGRSSLRLDADMHGVSPFNIRSIRQLRTARVSLDLRADSVSSEELQKFLPGPLAFLRRAMGLEVQAKGTFHSLAVEKLILRTPRTFLRLQGTVANLDHPADLFLDVNAHNAILDLRDAPDYLPGLDLPDLRALGSVTCDLAYEGKPLDFSASVTALRQQSRIIARAKMNLEHEIPEYEYDVEAQDVDLASILHDSSMSSRLNGTVSFNGSGFNPRTMRALFRAEIDSSEFWSLPINRSAVVVDIAEGMIRSHLSLSPSASRIMLTGTASVASHDSTSFAVNGTAQSLDLAGIAKIPRLASDLSFQIESDGTLRQGQLQRATARLMFRRSSLGEDQFEGGKVSIGYDGKDSLHRSLAIRSDIAELFVDGSFQPASFFEGLARGASVLSQAVRERIRRTEAQTPLPPARIPRVPLMPPQTNARVLLGVGDFYPIGLLLGERLEGAALLDATVTGGPDSLNLSGSLDIPEFLLGQQSPTSLLYTSLDFDLKNLRAERTLDSLSGQLQVSSDRIAVGSTFAENISSSVQLAADSLAYQMSGLVDSLAQAELEGSAVHHASGYHIVLPVVRAGFSDYIVENGEPVDLLWSHEGLLIQSAVLQHEGESVTISGLLHPEKNSNLNIEVEDFLLKNLQWFSRNPTAIRTFSRYTGILRANVDLEGSLQDPRWSFGLNAEGVRVRETVLGQIVGSGSFTDGIATVDVAFRSNPQQTSSPPDLVIKGRVPFRKAADERSPGAVDRMMNLDVKSSNFSLEILDAFIPVVSNLTGRVTCDVKIRGTLQKPSYQGSLRVQGARFVFTPLNITYLLDGELVPSGDQIALRNVIVRNVPNERPNGGSVTLSGLLTLEGLVLKQFDLKADGDLLVMKESVAPSRETLYGDLLVATGSDGIHWRGAPTLSMLSGDIYIRNANLSLPPGRESFAERDRSIDYVFVDDTTRVVPVSARDRRSLSQQLSERMRGQRETTQNMTTTTSNGSTGSFLDNIIYNLTIETRGITQLRIIINQLTNEVLFADLKGRLVFNKDRQETRLTGEVDVGERSYYNYIRQFQASGRLLFTGDPSNPELDVTATYEGFHRPPTTSTSPDSTAAIDMKVTVTLNIKGTRKEPKVTMNMALTGANGEPIATQSPDVEADAISFLVSGKFRDELTSQERSSLLTTSLAGIGSTILSGPLTEFVRREFGFIKSVDVLYYGGPIQESTDIRLTGELGNAVYRLGGKVFSDIGNTNVNVQYPMSAILQSDAWRNFILEYERRVEEFGTYDQRREPINAIKLLYRITF